MHHDDELEYAIRSKMRWRREAPDWLLFYDRRRMGRVVPDPAGLFRSIKSGGRVSDRAALSWAKDAVLGEAIREIEWSVRHGDARDPRKCPENRGVKSTRTPPLRQTEVPATPTALAA